MLQPTATSTIRELRTGAVWDANRLFTTIETRAAALARQGVGTGSTVILARKASGSFFADLFAVWRLGACAACADASLSQTELRNLAAFLDPTVVLVDDGFTTRLDTPVTCFDTEPTGSAEAPPATPPTGALDGDALVLFTSGTTGEPKGVVHSFRSLLARASLNRAHIGDRALDRTLCMLPAHFGHGLIGNCLTPILAGHDLHLVPFDRETAANLGAAVDQHGITFLSSVPTNWRMLFDAGADAPAPSLLRVQVGSAPLAAGLWQRIIEWSGTRDVANAYGITETANWIGGASAVECEPADGLIGTAWGGRIAIRDATGRIVDRGEGELVVQSPSLMRGYLAREDLTREVLAGGWFHTGDTGEIDERGMARISGRRKNEINRAGVKIQPEDVDIVLERHPEVAEACTFGIADEMRGEIVGCAVRARGGRPLDDEELRSFCAGSMRAHAIPERFFFVAEIPKTDRGKINRARVRDHCLRPDESARSA